MLRNTTYSILGDSRSEEVKMKYRGKISHSVVAAVNPRDELTDCTLMKVACRLLFHEYSSKFQSRQ